MFFGGIGRLMKYDLFGEYAGLGLSIMLLAFAFITKPKRTKAYLFLIFGTFLSVIATLIQIAIAKIASNVAELYDRDVFTCLLIAFLAVYILILLDIFNYVMHLAGISSKKPMLRALIYVILMTVYAAGAANQLLLRLMFYVRSDRVDITHFTKFYCIAGIGCSVACLAACIYGRESISRIVMRGVMITVPCEIIVLIMQMFNRHMVFSSITYVIPLVAFYLLFHSNPYDELTGCQDINAMESRFLRRLKSKKVFYIAYFYFPKILDSSSLHDYNSISEGLAVVCRKIERLSRNIYLYRVNYGTFLAIIEVS